MGRVHYYHIRYAHFYQTSLYNILPSQSYKHWIFLKKVKRYFYCHLSSYVLEKLFSFPIIRQKECHLSSTKVQSYWENSLYQIVVLVNQLIQWWKVFIVSDFKIKWQIDYQGRKENIIKIIRYMRHWWGVNSFRIWGGLRTWIFCEEFLL